MTIEQLKKEYAALIANHPEAVARSVKSANCREAAKKLD